VFSRRSGSDAMLSPKPARPLAVVMVITLMATACVPGGSLRPRVSPQPSATVTSEIAVPLFTDAPAAQGHNPASATPSSLPEHLAVEQPQSSQLDCSNMAARCTGPGDAGPDVSQTGSGSAVASKTAPPTTTIRPTRTRTSTPTAQRATATEPVLAPTLQAASTATPQWIEPTRQSEPTQPAQAPTEPAGDGYPGPGDGDGPLPGDGYPGPGVETQAPPTVPPQPTSPPSDGYPSDGGGYPGP